MMNPVGVFLFLVAFLVSAASVLRSGSRFHPLSTLVALVLVGVASGCARPEGHPGRSDQRPEIDRYVESVMSAHEVPGLALAVIRNGRVVHEGYYGLASIERAEKVDHNTLFRLYSVSKLMTSVGIFGLIENGTVSLEDPLRDHLDGLPPNWGSVQVRHLLAHASGLPDVLSFETQLADPEFTDEMLFSKLFENEMDFETGHAWRYNQTNYLLLKHIIEARAGTLFEDYILENQFADAVEGDVVFSSSTVEPMPRRAAVYRYEPESGRYIEKIEDHGRRAHGLNGVNLTLKEMMRWNERLDDGDLLRDETKTSMWTPFEYLAGNRAFLHGWDVYPLNGESSLGFTGGAVSAFRKFPDHGLTVIVLTNGFRYFSVHNTIVNHVAGLVDSRLADPARVLTQALFGPASQLEVDEVEGFLRSVVADSPEVEHESVFNSLGYQLLSIDRADPAVEVFDFVAEAYPDSANAFDSLAEGYLARGDLELSHANYRRSLALDPENSNAERMLEQIEKRQKAGLEEPSD